MAASSRKSSGQRSISPPRVNIYNHSPSSPSVRFSLDNLSISAVRRNTEVLKNLQSKQPKRTCMCSPTMHPGSFRCSLHKGFNIQHASSGYAPSNRLNARRSAMTNSLVRIGGVEGDLSPRFSGYWRSNCPYAGGGVRIRRRVWRSGGDGFDLKCYLGG
ncbi:Serine-rich protein-related [Hibiscus syriacus]|uniref:Serine-rich protein-related n=1 Tax=Hibiscus syriacus TaxID=106335 RepID=A0A6A2Z837_HIBSY|nr:Serine-rich protein-related [Hibiscus syriacus]